MSTLTEIDQELIAPFVHGAAETMKVQFSIPARAGKPGPKDQEKEPALCIAAIMSLTSNIYVGTIAVSFTRELFLAMMSNMLGRSYTEIDNAIEDGASEFLNITYGWAKNVLNHKGYGFELAIPTMVRAEKISIRHAANARVVTVPFETQKGQFQLEFASKD